MGKLSAAKVKALLERPGRYRDGDGLILFVRESGRASWVARVQQDGKRRDYGLGAVRAVSLAEAREKARIVKAAVVAGRDPHVDLRPPKALTRTFREAALQYVETQAEAGKSAEAKRRQRLAQLKTYAFPALGKLQVQSIEADQIADCLRPIWTGKPETARQVRGLIIRVLRSARPDGALFIGTLGPAISDRLPRQPEKGRHVAMPYRDLPTFMARLGERRGMGALALRALILTAARSGEIRGAAWGELDLEEAVWTVPAERMKGRKVHRVPLSPQAVAAFQAAAAVRRAGTDLVFPSGKGTMLSDMTLTKALRDMKEPFTVHGFRSTFRDWAAEQTSSPGEIAEAALAHAVPNAVEAAYRRTTFFDKRRELMDTWGRFAAGDGGAEIIALPRKRVSPGNSAR
jgi:integrase